MAIKGVIFWHQSLMLANSARSFPLVSLVNNVTGKRKSQLAVFGLTDSSVYIK